jgi:hypothetical protein
MTAATEISPKQNLRVFQSLNDFYADIWKNDDARPWDHYFREQRFRYFWDTRTVEPRKK